MKCPNCEPGHLEDHVIRTWRGTENHVFKCWSCDYQTVTTAESYQEEQD